MSNIFKLFLLLLFFSNSVCAVTSEERGESEFDRLKGRLISLAQGAFEESRAVGDELFDHKGYANFIKRALEKETTLPEECLDAMRLSIQVHTFGITDQWFQALDAAKRLENTESSWSEFASYIILCEIPYRARDAFVPSHAPARQLREEERAAKKNAGRRVIFDASNLLRDKNFQALSEQNSIYEAAYLYASNLHRDTFVFLFDIILEKVSDEFREAYDGKMLEKSMGVKATTGFIEGRGIYFKIPNTYRTVFFKKWDPYATVERVNDIVVFVRDRDGGERYRVIMSREEAGLPSDRNYTVKFSCGFKTGIYGTKDVIEAFVRESNDEIRRREKPDMTGEQLAALLAEFGEHPMGEVRKKTKGKAGKRKKNSKGRKKKRGAPKPPKKNDVDEEVGSGYANSGAGVVSAGTRVAREEHPVLRPLSSIEQEWVLSRYGTKEDYTSMRQASLDWYLERGSRRTPGTLAAGSSDLEMLNDIASISNIPAYSWSGLVRLVRALGGGTFGSDNSGHFYIGDTCFNLHYVHTKGHRLYNTLVQRYFRPALVRAGVLVEDAEAHMFSIAPEYLAPLAGI